MIFKRSWDIATAVTFAILVATILLVTHPFLTNRYTFFLDFTSGPGWDPISLHLYGFDNPAYGGSLPLFAVLSSIAVIVGAGIAQSLLFAGLIVLTAVSGYRTLPGNQWPRLYGALLLLVNPFVYSRLLVGQWAVIWGLAVLPLVLTTYTEYVENGEYWNLLFAVGALTLLGFNAHLLYASSILLGSLTFFRYIEQRQLTVVRRSLTVALVSIPVNAYWLFPVLFSGRTSLSNVSSTDLSIYAPHAGSTSVLYATATMHGFWRSGYAYAKDIVPQVQLFFVVILFLAVYGAVTHIGDEKRGYIVKALLVTAVTALLLGSGVNGPAGSVFRWLFKHIPFFSGLRDANKLVALLVVAYVYLGSLGVDELLTMIGRLDRNRSVSLLFITLIVLTPLSYTFPMVTGYAGQVSSQDYPDGWYQVKSHLEQDDGDYNVLFLPWHQYMDYSWLDGRQKRISTPARQFFSKPVIQGDNVEIGSVYSSSSNPISRYVEFLFGLGPANDPYDDSNLGERLAQINVKYVLVTKEADWSYYDTILRDQRDLSLTYENKYFRVYRNERRVSRSYATNRVTSVRNWLHLVTPNDHHNRARTNTTDPSKTRRIEFIAESNRRRLDVTKRSSSQYRIEGTTRKYTVFVPTQQTVENGWRYDGNLATRSHLGFLPVFESQTEGGDLRFAPFYRLFLPNYILSVLTVLLLLWYGLSSSMPFTSAIKRLQRARSKITRSPDDHDK